MYIVFCRKMKTVLAIAVITCVFVMGQAKQNQCVSRLFELGPCISMLGSDDDVDVNTICRDCGTSLIRLFRDCESGVGIDAIRNSKL